MKKKFMSKTMKIFLPLLLLFSIGSFITSSVMLLKSDYSLTNYFEFEEILYDVFGHDYLYFKNWLSTGNYESPLSQSYPLNNITSIDLNFPNSNIDIRTGETSNIQFDCINFDGSSQMASSSIVDGTLTLTENNVSSNTKYSLTIPTHFNGKLSIKTKSGEISLNNFSIENLDITSYDSNIALTNILSKDILISNSNESIYIERVTSENLRVSNINSDIYISDSSSNLDIKNSRGEIKLSNLKNTNHNLSTDSGDVEIDLQYNNNFNFNFNTKSGLLENDLELNQFTIENIDNNKLIKMNSSSNTINITTNSGNLEISKEY